jgi:hypothetical protein
LHADSSPDYDFSLLKKKTIYIGVMCDSSLKVQFLRKSSVEFWVGIVGEFPHLSLKALNILHPLATPYLCKTGFSAVAAIRMKYRSMMKLENDLGAAIFKLQPWYDKLCSKRQPHPSHQSRYEGCILFQFFFKLNNI